MKKLLIISLIILLTLTGCSAADPLNEDVYIGGTLYLWDGVVWSPASTSTGNVTSGAVIADNSIVRGDGGAFGVQSSVVGANNVSINDFGTLTATGDLNGFDINAGNDLNATNDLDVTDNATIGGRLTTDEGMGILGNYPIQWRNAADDTTYAYIHYDGNLTIDEVGVGDVIVEAETGEIQLNSTTDMNGNDVYDILSLNLTDPTELTISDGSITVTQGFHKVDTEDDTPTDNLDTINGGATGDILVLSGANDAREIIINSLGNIRFPSEHMLEVFTFASPAGSSGTYYTGGYYAAPAASTTLTNAAPTLSYGTANSAYGAHAFIVAGGAGTTDIGTVSIVVSGTSITEEGVRTAGDSETLVADITTMVLNNYYQTDHKWIGPVTYTLTAAGGATVYSATFNYGRAAYDSFDSRLHTAKLFEVMGRAGASDSGFDIQLLHHETTGWTYSAAAFMPGTTPVCSLATDYGAESDLIAGERFKYAREVNVSVDGQTDEGLLIRIITTANKAVEFMDASIYVEAIPNDLHLKNTNQSIQMVYNGTNWMKQ